MRLPDVPEGLTSGLFDLLRAMKHTVESLDSGELLSGTIGGWTIDYKKIYKSTAYIHSGSYISFGAPPPSVYDNTLGVWLGYDPSTKAAKMSLYTDANNYFQFADKVLIKAANFSLNASGNIIATGGTIGGFTISASEGLYAGSGVTRVHMKPGAGIWAGATAIGSAPFSVTNAGALKAESGTVGGWTLASNKISITGIELDQANNRIRAYTGANYVDLTAAGLTGYDSVLGTTFRLFTDGSAPEFSSGIIKECVYEIYTSGVIRTDADPISNGGLLINNTDLKGYTSSGLKVLQFIYDGTDQGDAYIGDYDSANNGIKYDHSAGRLCIKGLVEIIGNPALQNMLMNPGFEETDGTNAYYWSSGSGFTTETSGGDGSNKYYKITRSGANKIGYHLTPDGGYRDFEVNEGEVYELGGSCKSDGTCQYYLNIQTLDKDKTWQRTVGLSGDQTNWVPESITVIIAAGEKFLRFMVRATLADGWAAYDNVYLKRIDEKAWSFTHASDRTTIDGGRIYTDSIVVGGLSSGVTDLMFTSDTRDFADLAGATKPADNADVSPGLPLDEGLVGYWSFDDGAGAVAVDGSGKSQDGTGSGTISFVDGVSGKAIEADGTGNPIEITPAIALQNAVKTGDFSISFWWEPNSEFDWADVISFDTNEGDNHLRFEHGNDDATRAGYWFGHSDQSINRSAYITYGERHHFVIIFDRTTGYLSCYIDGELDQSASKTLTTYSTVTKLTFFDAGTNLGDILDEVRIYNKVLTESEIKALYLYPAGNKSSQISGAQTPWAHASDITYIDGGNIYTNTITATQINGAGFGTLTISSGKIAINTTDALEIQASGNVLIKQGGDINLEYGGDINFVGSSYTTSLNSNAVGTDLYFEPDTIDVVNFYVGYVNSFDVVGLYAASQVSMVASNTAETQSCSIVANQGIPGVDITIRDNSVSKRMRIYFVDGGVHYMGPDTDGEADLGRDSYRWANLFVDAINGGAPCRIKTGAYTGNGSTSYYISGVGFTGKFVWIWQYLGAEGNAYAGIKSTDMGIYSILLDPANHKYMDNSINSFGADGFYVDDDGSNQHPNASGVLYKYLVLG